MKIKCINNHDYDRVLKVGKSYTVVSYGRYIDVRGKPMVEVKTARGLVQCSEYHFE